MCIAYVFQWGYGGKQPSILSLGPTSHLSGKQLEDDGISVCILSLAGIGSSQLLEVCRNWSEDIHVGNEKLCIIHSDTDAQFF